MRSVRTAAKVVSERKETVKREMRKRIGRMVSMVECVRCAPRCRVTGVKEGSLFAQKGWKEEKEEEEEEERWKPRCTR